MQSENKTITVTEVMSFDKTHTGLKTELSKLAKTSNIQAGLPFILRGLPVAAILAGDAIAKVSGGSNRIEERMLGSDETLVLNMPSQASPSAIAEKKGDYIREGVTMMCVRCRKTSGESSQIGGPGADGWGWFGRASFGEQGSLGQGNRRQGLFP
ncbi:hypothetical protein NUW58_g5303 [Xylaria curta]|uniref:Uncharacterized protein n=1 Tax=Xylaria curta TaxID=42375 RepID=A0ACC1P4F6_9PEZI|nr:hypothetical protein NUW58_g5303 [Xylaria curta]